MNELEQLRDGIDKIDRELLPMFIERMRLCGQVGEYKKRTDMPVLDSGREKQLLENKLNLIEDKDKDVSNEVYEFFNSIMAISRTYQKKLISGEKFGACSELLENSVARKDNPKVVCFGYEGSYSEEAAEKFFENKCEKIYVSAFVDAFDALTNNGADYAVLPIENSSAGVIAEVMDLLAERKLYIVGEEYIPIRHCLMGVKGTKTSDIKKLYSHEQAFLQCPDFIKSLGDVECISYYSTALSAKSVAQMNDVSYAAIASERTAEIYGLEILAKNINSVDCNTTRFVVISTKPEVSDDASKVSIVFNLDHESGALYRVLSSFAHGGLNLLKLESRPVREKPFEYKFFADYTGNLRDAEVRAITEEIAQMTINLILLGNYTNSDGEHR